MTTVNATSTPPGNRGVKSSRDAASAHPPELVRVAGGRSEVHPRACPDRRRIRRQRSAVQRVAGFRERFQVTSKPPDQPSVRRDTTGGPESDDRGPQFQDHDGADGKHATPFEEGQHRRSPRRRGRGNADANQGCDETELNDDESCRHCTVHGWAGCHVRGVRGGCGTVDAHTAWAPTSRALDAWKRWLIASGYASGDRHLSVRRNPAPVEIACERSSGRLWLSARGGSRDGRLSWVGRAHSYERAKRSTTCAGIVAGEAGGAPWCLRSPARCKASAPVSVRRLGALGQNARR